MCKYYYAFRPSCNHHKEITQLCQIARTLHQECGPHHKRRNWSADYIASSDGCEQCTATQPRSRNIGPHGERRERHHLSRGTLPQPVPRPWRRSQNANRNENAVSSNPRNPVAPLTRRLNARASQFPPYIYDDVPTNLSQDTMNDTNRSTRGYIHNCRSALAAEREASIAMMDEHHAANRERERERRHRRDQSSSDEEDFGVENHFSSFGRGRRQHRHFENEMQSIERGLDAFMIRGLSSSPSSSPQSSPSPSQVYPQPEPHFHTHTHTHTRRHGRIRSRIFDRIHRSRHDEEEDSHCTNGEVFTQHRLRYESPDGTIHTRYMSPEGTEHARRRRRWEWRFLNWV